MSPGQQAAIKKSGNGALWALIAVFLVGIAAIGWAIFGPSAPWNPPPQIKTEANPVAATPESLAAAKSLYMSHCAHCHGQTGAGDGSEAGKLSVQPTDFTDALAMKKATDGELFWRIGAGRRPMPSFAKKLTEQERWELVNYIRTLASPLPK
ncbi:MAG TPA: cytochrome c [Candidatus Acidoferrum sp.]|nr:cytochrome c [Candidatus Acidoferrum sp.]